MLVGMQIGIATVENSMEIPLKIKNRTTIWSSNSSGYFSKQNKNTNLKRYRLPCLHSSIITIAKIWKQSKSSWTDEWIKKMCYLRMNTQIYIGFPGDSV